MYLRLCVYVCVCVCVHVGVLRVERSTINSGTGQTSQEHQLIDKPGQEFRVDAQHEAPLVLLEDVLPHGLHPFGELRCPGCTPKYMLGVQRPIGAQTACIT
jgi:hypothetical protein